MGNRIFLLSDTHFFHDNILSFKREDGTPLRPFSTIEEMNETLVQNWNSVVRNCDKLYALGDVCFKNATAFKSIFSRLNGEKILIKGNHDNLSAACYLEYFKDIRATHPLNGLILSHIPIHPSQKGRYRGNIHGHTHSTTVSDPWYYCVSVEQINYTPIDIEEIFEYYRKGESIV